MYEPENHTNYLLLKYGIALNFVIEIEVSRQATLKQM